MKPSTFLENYNFHFNVQEKQDMERDLRELVSQVAKEQREICAEYAELDDEYALIVENIRDAPEPNFD